MAITNRCYFSCTKYVLYECLYKPRTIIKEADNRLKSKLQGEIGKGLFQSYSISIEDLQNLEILERRKSLSKGELSSIVFAQKTRQAFLTDDHGARKLSESYIGPKNTQTIPHLFGWLAYSGLITDSDKIVIIQEHENNGGQLSKFFNEVFNRALELNLAERSIPLGSI
jgi:predicted nucleic acid-binding protein